MPELTWQEIESTVQSVFPAAQVGERIDRETWEFAENEPLGNESWIDWVEQNLVLEEDRLADAEDQQAGLVQMIAILNVRRGTDTHGRTAFVPIDYSERYGAPPWPKQGSPDAFGDAYDDPPIDSVPPDDRINLAWAEGRIFSTFPHAEFMDLPNGEGLVLHVTLLKCGDHSDKRLFQTDVDPLQMDFDLSADGVPGGNVWEREYHRRLQAKQAIDAIPVDLPIAEQVAMLGEILPQDLKGAGWSEVAQLAAHMLTNPGRTPVSQALLEGESSTVEFKIAARAVFPSGERSPEAEADVARTVAGFMNNKGGVLVIGVNDAGRVVGLDSDLVRVKRNDDKLLLSIQQSLESKIGIGIVARSVTVTIETVDGSKVVVVRVQPGYQPAYVQVGQEEDFYIRSGPSTKRLPVSEVSDYIASTWGRGSSEQSTDRA